MNEESKETKIPSRDEKDLIQLAKDLYAGKVFTDRNINPNDSHLALTIFMPLMLSKKLEDDVGLIYEYLTEAGPRSLNGYPMFLSMKFINKKDTDFVFEKYQEIKKAMDGI